MISRSIRFCLQTGVQLTAGFRIINPTAAINTVPTLNGMPRAGTLIARFSF